MNFVEELKWRGMLHQMMPGTDEMLSKGMATAYVGIDPTADSLHIGHLCGVMMLRHFQQAGHKPLALVGGATGMIGAPSGKRAARNLLNEETLRHLVACNITTGTELIRRKLGADADAYALTCPLITKADGKKFGKTEQGNVWLDRRYTTPYKFYQFWLNVGDEEAERYIKIFTSLKKEEIDALIEEHRADPGRRVLQKKLGEEVTVLVHSREDYEMAVEASQILFGKATKESLLKLDEDTLLSVFDGVPHFEAARDQVVGAKAVDVFAEVTQCFASKGEMRKLTQGGGVSLNKEKLTAFDREITAEDLLDGKYLLVQRGKKNYFLITVR